MKICGIYQIQSKIKPERIYIGSAINIRKRWIFHLWNLKKNIHNNQKLQRHYNKYGESDLVFIIVELCFPEFLTAREQYYINKLKPYFNICKIAGNPMLGRNHSEKTKEKLRIASTGRHHSEETKKNLRVAWEKRKLIPVSEKSKQKMRESSAKFYNSEKGKKEKERRSERASGGKNPMYNNFSYRKGKKVINFITNEIFDSIRLAAKSINIKERTLHAQLRGENPNKTNLRLIV